jgi:hypothetical protein
MHKDEKNMESANAAATNAEIDAAAERLSRAWLHSTPRSHSPGPSQIQQSLARGRSHMVALEIRKSSRRLTPTREGNVAKTGAGGQHDT